MKASELIKNLMDLYLEHGDVDVTTYDWYRIQLDDIVDNPKVGYRSLECYDLWEERDGEENKGDKIIVI